MLRDINGVDFHFDFLDPATDKLPEGGCSVRIGDGHVHQGLDRIAHGVEHEGGTASLGRQQVLVGRLLFVVFGLGKPGAFDKVHHTHRGVPELLTGPAG